MLFFLRRSLDEAVTGRGRRAWREAAMTWRRANEGVVALLTVIIVGALVLAIGVTTAFVGQTDLLIAARSDRAHATRALASACIEEAAHRLRANPAYAGGTVPLGADTCSMTVSGSGSTRTVTASATVSGYTKTIIAGLTLRQNGIGNATGWAVTSWSEGDPP